MRLRPPRDRIPDQWPGRAESWKEQTGTHEQDESEGHFGDDQQSTGSVCMMAERARPPGLPEQR